MATKAKPKSETKKLEEVFERDWKREQSVNFALRLNEGFIGDTNSGVCVLDLLEDAQAIYDYLNKGTK